MKEQTLNVKIPNLGLTIIDDYLSEKHCELTSLIPCNFRMDVASVQLNEFNAQFLATLAFPTLFPGGTADPTTDNHIRALSSSETGYFAQKIKHHMFW